MSTRIELVNHIAEKHTKFHLDHFLTNDPNKLIKIVNNSGPWPVTVCSICGHRLLSAQAYYVHLNEDHTLPYLNENVDLDSIDFELNWLNLES